MPSFQARRRHRTGKGFLPPNPKQWENEHNGLDLREDLGLTLEAALPVDGAFDLVEDVLVLPHGAIPDSFEAIEHFRGPGAGAWSGLALAIPDGRVLVLFNDSHPQTRIRATLMEEFFHLRLGHRPTTIRVYSGDGAARSYDPSVETAAFGSGAAALVPYRALRVMVDAGIPPMKIARKYEVSEALVTFRLKVTRLYHTRRLLRPVRP